MISDTGQLHMHVETDNDETILNSQWTSARPA